MLENFQRDSWGLIPPLRVPSLLPHDLCHGRSSCSRQLQNFSWAIPDPERWCCGKCFTQYAICRLPAVCFLLLLFVVYSFLCCVSPLIFKSQSLEEVESTTIPWLWRTLGWQALSHRLREDFADTENSHYWEKWELLGRTKRAKLAVWG